jgi:5-hydroxyisourate hydrolase
MISTHILDTSVGNPAPEVSVDLFITQGGEDKLIESNKTDSDGRIKFNCPKSAGNYKLVFHIEEYFQRQGVDHFFTNAPVSFKISNIDRNYHVPLLVNPFGYSTYRGS